MQVTSLVRVLIFAVSIFLTGTCALAQSTFSLRGVAEDDTGAIIPRAQVVLKDGKNVEVAHTVANDLGEFSFMRLAAGDYSIELDAPGFKKTQARASVGVGSADLQHFRMKVASVNQEITVKAGDPVAMDGNINSVEVNHDLLKSLPVKDDNPLAAASVFLDPAANGAEGTKIVVDGVETTDLDVPSSSVKSVAVNKNPYAAEFSRPGKGRIEVVTRPGSLTRVHHHFVTTFRNSSLDATNAFATTRPQRSRSFWQSDINGPLFGQNGSFYFGGEYLHDDQSSFVHAITPTGVVDQTQAKPERTWRLLGRVDYHLNPINTLSMRYNFSHDTIEKQGVGAFDLASRAYNSQSSGHELRMAETALLSVNFSNEIRFAFKDKDHSATPLSNAPARIVLGAFNEGGAQINQDLGERSYELQNLSTWIRGRHTMRFGITAKRRDLDVTEASNFGGTFSYSDLASFAAGHPFLFTINQGTPFVSFAQNEYSYFVQDEMRLRPNLTIMLGLRHELQSNLDDHNNLAPRFGVSYAPGKGGLVFRAGGGIFYDRQPWLMQEQALLFDNNHIHRVVIQDPAFNQIPPAGLGSSLGSIVTISPSIRSPYVSQASVGVDKRFGSNNSLSVEFTAMRGLKLYRTRNLNAPLPSTGLPPNPNFVNINQFQSTGSSRANSLSVTYRAAIKQRAEFLAQYTLSKSTDDTSGMFSQPSDEFNLALERGRSDFDRRHRFNLAGIFQLPYGFKLGTITSISSGIPFNITTGSDTGDDSDNVLANDRPAGVPRNSGNGPMYSDVDIRLSKKIVLGAKKEHGTRYLEFRADAFNALNQVNATNYVGVITSPLFGRANSSLPARQLQLSVKASF
jgi:carboxypeptidase family protein/TonB-dependent receptor-like protein